MTRPPRVALFADTFYETNGAALTCRLLEAFASRNWLPFLSVHSGPATRLFQKGSVTTLELRRSRATFSVDTDLGYDPLLWRQSRTVRDALTKFSPDIVHITSPSDFSELGAYCAHDLHTPTIASYHTNLHQYAALRLQKLLGFAPPGLLKRIGSLTEAVVERGFVEFYKIARALLAPNPELRDSLQRATGKPCHIMRRGVDAELFHPSKRDVTDGVFRLGFVGRLRREKNLGFLVELERALLAVGTTNYRFVVVGDGSERAWLERNLLRAEFTGVLKGDDLARAYANLDLFVFPSHTDAFGNVIQEALASGVPAIVTATGGPKFLVRSGISGFVAEDDRDFVGRVLELMSKRDLLAKMSLAARQSVLTASWDKVFEEVYDSYDSCIQGAYSGLGQLVPRHPRPRLDKALLDNDSGQRA